MLQSQTEIVYPGGRCCERRQVAGHHPAKTTFRGPQRRQTARKHDLLLDVSNGRLEVWAKHFADTEPELLDFIDAIPDTATYYDIGASITHFALYAAMRIKRVIALEPEALNFATGIAEPFLEPRQDRRRLQRFSISLQAKQLRSSTSRSIFTAQANIPRRCSEPAVRKALPKGAQRCTGSRF